MAGSACGAITGRVEERRRAVALARCYREVEGLSIGHVAERLGRSPATIKAYFYDPTGEKAPAVGTLGRRLQWLRRLYAAAQRQADAYAYCKACHPGAIARRWTRARALDAMRVWRRRYGRLLFGTWTAARAAAVERQ